jgi:hypothetical protein
MNPMVFRSASRPNPGINRFMMGDVRPSRDRSPPIWDFFPPEKLQGFYWSALDPYRLGAEREREAA